MTILMTSTQEVKSLQKPTLEATLAELRQAKAAWLAEAERLGHLDACRRIARWLGKPFEAQGWPLWKCYRWQSGDVVLQLFEGPGHWLPAEKVYDRVSVLIALARGLPVCYHRESHDLQGGGDNFFVPGHWVSEINLASGEAETRARALGLASTERDRQALIRQLLIGQEV